MNRNPEPLTRLGPAVRPSEQVAKHARRGMGELKGTSRVNALMQSRKRSSGLIRGADSVGRPVGA